MILEHLMEWEEVLPWVPVFIGVKITQGKTDLPHPINPSPFLIRGWCWGAE
jgi:hypothetical protein